MKAALSSFPLAGAAVQIALNMTAKPEELWEVTDIETLSDPPAVALGGLWGRVQLGPVTISTSELCDALMLAKQVISLNVRLITNPDICLVIEDGLTLVCDIP